jgi:hypothetical protein
LIGKKVMINFAQNEKKKQKRKFLPSADMQTATSKRSRRHEANKDGKKD